MTTVDQVAPLDPAATAPMPVASRLIGAIAVGIALLSATATFLVLAGLTPIAPVHEVVVKLLLGNAVTGLLLLAIIGREVWVVVQARRRGRAGSRLHVQIVGLFAVIAAVPTVLVAVVASTTLDRGLDRFFSTRTRAMIEQSLIVANAYVSEHAAAIRGEDLAMAYDLGRAKPMFDPTAINSANSSPRRPPGAISPRRSSSSPTARPSSAPTSRWTRKSCCRRVQLLAETNETEPQVALIPEGDHVAAVVKLHGYDDMYLYVARLLDPRVVQQLRATQESVGEYANLEARRLGIQIAFALMFAVIALIVLLSSAWIGLDFANRLVAPIRRLIGAANVVSTGNLHVQVPVHRSEGDLAQSRRNLQQDDAGAAHAARRHRARARPHRQPAAIYRSRAGRRQRRRHRRQRRRPHLHSQPLGGAADRTHRKRSARPAARRSRARTRRDFPSRAQRQSAPGPASGRRHARRPGAQFFGARDQRAGDRIRARLRHHHRRHHRAGPGAALLGLGRYRAAHRARDQESADADPAVGRAAAPQIRQVDHRRPRRVRAMHRDHRAPGRRHQAHGRRVLALRAHAEGGDRRRGRRRYRAPGGVPVARRPSRYRLRGRAGRRTDAGALRSAADLAGAHQHHQERHRGDRRGAAGRTRARPHRRQRAARRQRGRHRRDR